MERIDHSLFMASTSHGIPMYNDGHGSFGPIMENYGDAINGFDDEFILFDHPIDGGGHLDRLSLLMEGELAAFDHHGGGGGGGGGGEGASFSSYDDDQDHHGLLQVFGGDEYAAAAAEAGEGGDGGDSPCDLAARKGAKRDRSKTLISERKRRVRMKERLYELRSLVPTISKMDKASIIADAVAYVKDLQSQAKKLEEEINLLESSSSSSPSKGDRAPQIPRRKGAAPRLAAEIEQAKKTVEGKPLAIMQVNAYDVGAGKFYVKVAGSTGDGTAAASSSLYAAVVSLSCFELESSNFVLDGGEGFLFTVTFLSRAQMSSASMELWVMGALIKQGFQLMQTAFN